MYPYTDDMADTPKSEAPIPDEPTLDGTDALAAEVEAIEAEETAAESGVDDTDELLRKLALSNPEAAAKVRAELYGRDDPGVQDDPSEPLSGDVIAEDGTVLDDAVGDTAAGDTEPVDELDADDLAPIALDDEGSVFLDADGNRVDADGDPIWDGHTVEYRGETWQWAEPSDGGLFLFTSSGSKFLPMSVKGDLSIGFLFSVMSEKSFMRASYRIMDRNDDFDLFALYSLVNVIIEAHLDLKSERDKAERLAQADRRARRIAARQEKAAARKALAAGKST